MNYIPEVAKMLGVEIGEEFRIENGNCYKFTEEGLMRLYQDSGWYRAEKSLYDILNGTYKLVKLPKPILDEKEKEYLSAFIKPFRHRVKYICKDSYVDFKKKSECLRIKYDDYEMMYMPDFRATTMYKGMELDKKYTLEELGL